MYDVDNKLYFYIKIQKIFLKNQMKVHILIKRTSFSGNYSTGSGLLIKYWLFTSMHSDFFLLFTFKYNLLFSSLHIYLWYIKIDKNRLR